MLGKIFVAGYHNKIQNKNTQYIKIQSLMAKPTRNINMQRTQFDSLSQNT